jgi:capsular exopolysaccharide synthesis family protein
VYGQRWNITGLAITVSIVAALVVMSMRPVYRAASMLMIEAQQANLVSIEEVYGLGSAHREYFATQFEILKSRELAERVAVNLDIRHHPDFDPDQQKPLLVFRLRSLFGGGDTPEEVPEDIKLAAAVDAFAGKLTIWPVRNTQLVYVIFESHDPELAAAVVNEMASVYIASHLDAKLEVTQQAAVWLSERLQGLKQNLEQSESALQEYRDQEELVDIQGVKTLAARELDELTEDLVEARARRTQADSIYTQVRLLDERSPEALASLPAVLSHPLVQRLKEEEANAEQTVAELSRRYGPKHPKMIAAKSKLVSATDNLQKQVLNVVDGVENDFELATSSERALAAQLAQAKSRVQEINRKEFRLRELQRDLQTNRQLYDMFFTRVRETDEAGGMEVAHARVVDRGVVPRSPVKPRKTLTVAVAFLASLVAGVFLAFLKDALDSSLKTPEDIEERLSVPLLGAIPIVPIVEPDGPLLAIVEDRHSAFAESVRTVRTALLLSGLEKGEKLTVITSSVPGEGKSTLTINLAAALGQMEKTLIIDADLRRPVLARTCGLLANTPGLSNYIAGTADLGECVQTFEAAGVDILPAGVIPSNPLELISSGRFNELLEVLKDSYERIIIDSAPTHAVSDALVLASYADSVIYMIRADATPYKLVKQGIQRLVDSNAPVAGVVLNEFDARKAARMYGDQYDYSRYDNYYGGGGEGEEIHPHQGESPRVA